MNLNIQMLWPILVVILSNTVYNISSKSIPADINPFASLALTYVVAFVVAVTLFFFTGEQKNLLTEWGKVNWSVLLLGIAVVGLEFGFICAYRAGWKVGVCAMTANIGLAIVLLIVGYFMFKEIITVRQLAGMAVCVAGLVLISK